MISLQLARHAEPRNPWIGHSFCLKNFPWSLHDWFLVAAQVLIQVFRRPSLTLYLKDLSLPPLLSISITSPSLIVFIAHYSWAQMTSSQVVLPASVSLHMLFILPGMLLPFSSCGFFSTFRSQLMQLLQKWLFWSLPPPTHTHSYFSFYLQPVHFLHDTYDQPYIYIFLPHCCIGSYVKALMRMTKYKLLSSPCLPWFYVWFMFIFFPPSLQTEYFMRSEIFVCYVHPWDC